MHLKELIGPVLDKEPNIVGAVDARQRETARGGGGAVLLTVVMRVRQWELNRILKRVQSQVPWEWGPFRKGVPG